MCPRTPFRYICMLAALVGPLVAYSSQQEDPSGVRLLNAHEAQTLVDTALEQKPQVRPKPDCSHLVHQIYELSGFPYPYVSSFDLYEGIDNFRRVSTPRPGDLVVWPGHVGIVIDGVEHSFYSSVRSGLRTEYYDGPYWRTLGRPRFFRYRLRRPHCNQGLCACEHRNGPDKAPHIARAQRNRRCTTSRG